MSDQYEIRITRLTVNKPGEPIFSRYATTVEIEDEAGGEYLVIRQNNEEAKAGEIAITPEEWPTIKEAIEQLLPTLGDYD
jgi:hypothetical protein